MDTLPPEMVALIVAHLVQDRDLCRARAAHRCFHASPAAEAERRLARWHGKRTPADFSAVGLVEALVILADRGVEMTDPECVWAAVEHGHIEVLCFLAARAVPLNARRPQFGPKTPYGRPPCDLVTIAAASGRLDIILLLRAHGVEPPYGHDAIDAAARNGHGHVVDWLDAVAVGRCSDVVGFLHANRNRGIFLSATTHAAANGHLDAVAYLHGHAA